MEPQDPLAAPRSPDLSPERLTELLAPQLGGGRVVSVEATTIGTGQVGENQRLVLQYEPAGAGPSSVVAKFPSADPSSRAAAKAYRNYEVETSFYRELSGRVPMRTPACASSQFDHHTHDFLLLLEDLGAWTPGDQVSGCTFDQAGAAVAELSRLHALFWHDRALESMPWLHRITAEGEFAYAEAYRRAVPEFAARFAGRVTDDIVDAAERLADLVPAYQRLRRPPGTIAHGDYRVDNLMFTNDVPRVAVVDWQTVIHAHGVNDLAYFVGGAFDPAERAIYERLLIARYAAEMAAQGVLLDADELWRDYRAFAFSGLAMAVLASVMVQQTDRGDDLFVLMAQRHGRQVIELETVDALRSLC